MSLAQEPSVSRQLLRRTDGTRSELRPQPFPEDRLAREGLLVSSRGVKGGYQLARPAEQITVPEMIAALEGPIALTDCNLHEGACSQEPRCHVRTPWQRINRAVHEALSRIHLTDLTSADRSRAILPLASLGVDTTGIDTPSS